jgi:hypothetical protein
VIVSIADFSPLKYSALFYRTHNWGNGIELNFGCPNVRDDGAQHPIVSFDPLRMAGIMTSLKQRRDDGPQFTGVKLSPYSDPGYSRKWLLWCESSTVDRSYHQYVSEWAVYTQSTRSQQRKPARTAASVVGVKADQRQRSPVP